MSKLFTTKYIFTVLSVLCFVSCKTTTNAISDLSAQHQMEFKTALEHLEGERYSLAISQFESLAEKIKKGDVHWSAMYNVGSAYEKLNRCKKAEKIFSELAKNNNGNKVFEAQALLRLSYVNDCLGQPQRALIILKDAESRQKYLTETAKYVEIPARFSILYAQLDNKTQAMQFQNIALSGIQTLKAPIKDEKLVNQTVAKLFYIMGQVKSHGPLIQIHQYLSAFPYYQMYLVQSYLLADPRWSPLAKKELASLYQKLWLTYQKLSKKQKQTYQNDIFKQLRDLHTLALESESKELKAFQTFIFNKYHIKFKKRP